MIRHCVMFTWKPEATDAEKAAIAAGLDAMAALPFMRSFVHGPDAGIVDGNWDYVVNAEFDDVDGYRAYADDAAHQALIADHIRPAISARAAVQFEV